MNYVIKEFDKIEFVGFENRVTYDNAINYIPRIWQKNIENGNISKLAKFNSGEIKGLIGACYEMYEDGFDYFIATNIDEKLDVDYGDFIRVTTKGGKFAVFECDGYDSISISNTISKIFEFLPESGLERRQNRVIELYPDRNSCHIYFPVK